VNSVLMKEVISSQIYTGPAGNCSDFQGLPQVSHAEKIAKSRTTGGPIWAEQLAEKARDKS
jgi:hypothetical protein